MFAWSEKNPEPKKLETEKPDLEQQIALWQQHQNPLEADRLISAYQPFIRKTVASLSGRYLDTANDEEWSIGLSAFYEAMQRFIPDKGSFLSFSRLVIASRLKTYWQQEKRQQALSFDEMDFQQDDIDRLTSELSMADAIRHLASELLPYGIRFTDLVKATPKHRDTRQNVLVIAKRISQQPDLMAVIQKKKRLPIQLVSRQLKLSVKILKRNRIYVLAATLIYSEPDSEVAAWLDEVIGTVQ